MSERLKRIAIDGKSIGAKTMTEPLSERELELLADQPDLIGDIRSGRLWQNN